MKNFKYLFISVYLLTACVKDLPENNPFYGTPIVATYRIYESFATSFKVEGEIISTDEEEIIEKGFCWSTDTLPTILNQKTSVTRIELLPAKNYLIVGYHTTCKKSFYLSCVLSVLIDMSKYSS